eukprot:TRINITY_DN4306_c0_g1_i5.p1 TRINITY_DN4306_c0_g1~~TRINITY_DN4306_c0_g1_i5.p1  ORF type:complete len:211 (+),score=6.28 TRINITY_DN4306_c0_g1_i5:39-671(+)
MWVRRLFCCFLFWCLGPLFAFFFWFFFFFFKQKTAYEIRIRDWSSDVCSSDLFFFFFFFFFFFSLSRPFRGFPVFFLFFFFFFFFFFSLSRPFRGFPVFFLFFFFFFFFCSALPQYSSRKTSQKHSSTLNLSHLVTGHTRLWPLVWVRSCIHSRNPHRFVLNLTLRFSNLRNAFTHFITQSQVRPAYCRWCGFGPASTAAILIDLYSIQR